jgi:hypothetical protein
MVRNHFHLFVIVVLVRLKCYSNCVAYFYLTIQIHLSFEALF